MGTAIHPVSSDQTSDLRQAIDHYRGVRAFTEELCRPLEVEDYVIQSMPDASPAKWHLAHTSWFFETFLLKPNQSDWTSVDPHYAYLFNSYYNAAGPQHCRPRRGTLSRPTVEQVYEYRRQVDQAVERLLENVTATQWNRIRPVLTLGMNHEQQHQELLLSDIKHAFWCNPLRPAYDSKSVAAAEAAPAAKWVSFDEGLYWIGHDANAFAYDNESPRHRQFLEAFCLSSRLITNRQYLNFIEDGGYQHPEHWLSAGWATVRQQHWTAPIYWEKADGQWQQFTLNGMKPLAMDDPACHISYFEADAFARWAGHRLPTEAEWEVAAAVPIEGPFADSRQFHPSSSCIAPSGKETDPRGEAGKGANIERLGLSQMFGQLWQWTASPYIPYPGYHPAPGALGEYNGKFMCDQWVLRGGSCATSRSHIRRTYRNFFPADARWQFSGIRLAAASPKDAGP